jgi:hypothetical protein
MAYHPTIIWMNFKLHVDSIKLSFRALKIHNAHDKNVLFYKGAINKIPMIGVITFKLILTLNPLHNFLFVYV